MHESLFNSFFIGGFECADHINRSGIRINLLKETEHDIRVVEDYQLLCDVGIKTVREGVCWSAVETEPFVFNFDEVGARILAAEQKGIQQIWDLCHFGYPDGLIPTHPQFTERFKAFCKSFAEFHQALTVATLYVVPINEISFLSWHSGDVRGTVPFAINSGFDIKYHLCKACIAGMKVLKELVPTCKILVVEPLIYIHASPYFSEESTAMANEDQFQAIDIISGKLCMELGGDTSLFDFVGWNYYHNNQWLHNSQALTWPDSEGTRKVFSHLLHEAYLRYNKPVLVTETGHFGEGRALWLQEMTFECLQAIEMGVDLRALCIYPVTDRPDWDNLLQYHQCGLWDLDEQKNRIPCADYLSELDRCQLLVQLHLSLRCGTSV